MNPLQRLVNDRLDELGLSQRQAAGRTNGVLTNITLNRIARGETARISGKTLAGLTLALDLPRSVVEEAATGAAMPQVWEEMSSIFGKLPPDLQKRAAACLQEIEQEWEERQRQAAAEDRPFGR